ncbi:MAG TPA: histidine kinase dimerization/phospho-acceptor domain-containing protein, partial [Solirubrobacteraceae bacterium]
MSTSEMPLRTPRAPGAPVRLLRRARAALPRGNSLPAAEWARRHRFLLALLWLHALAIPLFGVSQGYGILHCLLEGGVVAAIAAAGTLAPDRKRASALVALGLLTSSALLVHFSHGVIEAHFHFFVVIVLLTLYEDWLPFLLAAGYVALHHGVMGAIDPGSVYNHADAVAHPWKWALIHAGFIAAAGAGALVAWRWNEDVREERQLALDRAVAAEHALAGANAELQRSNAELEQFAYVASHDLSEPLRTVSGFVQLLRRRYGGQWGEDADAFMEHAVGGTERMQQMIDGLLDYSRVGREDLLREEVDLGAVAAEALDALRARVEETGAHVATGELPCVTGDRRQLGRVVQNLLSNALKFSDGAPPRVELAATRQDRG